MPGSVRVARLFGIDVRIHVSWLLIFFLVVISLADTIYPASFPAWSRQKTFIVAAVTAGFFFPSPPAPGAAPPPRAPRVRVSGASVTPLPPRGGSEFTPPPPPAGGGGF